MATGPLQPTTIDESLLTEAILIAGKAIRLLGILGAVPEEIAGDMVLACLNKFPNASLDERESLLWLFARRRLSNLARSEGRQVDKIKRFAQELDTSPEKPPSDALLADLESCLSHLSIKQQTIIRMSYTLDMRAREIADLLSVSTDDVYQGRSLALKCLRQCLQDKGPYTCKNRRQ